MQTHMCCLKINQSFKLDACYRRKNSRMLSELHFIRPALSKRPWCSEPSTMTYVPRLGDPHLRLDIASSRINQSWSRYLYGNLSEFGWNGLKKSYTHV